MELIGRGAELAEVVDRLGTRRLVTLTGPAGIGKTTLAVAASDLVADRFERGVHVVDLTRVGASQDVCAAIAGQLGFASFEDLLSDPTDAPALLVVDSCEHVITAASDAVADILAACQSPTVLATSRSPLDLPEESLVVLGPLAVPLAGSEDDDSDAVRLFLERARDAGATIDVDELGAVAMLCRRLDGVPLALELAAARTRTMHPAEILTRLGEGDVLARPRYRGAARHRSLADTIDWSYRLLAEPAALVFERLGLLAGPFSAELGHAVGGDVGLDASEAADTLQYLVAASLVVAERSVDATRFRLLETVRAFARRRLEDRGTLADARDRLVDHVVDTAVRLLAAGGRRWDTAVLAELLSLYDNLIAALRWCLANDDDERRSMLITAVLWGVVHQGHTDEIAELCDEVLGRWPDSTDPFAVDAAATAATARCLLGDPVGAIELAERTLPVAEQYPTAPVTLRRAMGYAARALQDRDGALARFEEVSALARERGLLALALEADVTRAQLLAEGHEVDRAIELALAARQEAAGAGSAINEVWAASVLANLHLRQDLTTGLVEAERALEVARRMRYPAGESLCLRSLAWGRVRAGDHVGAASTLCELFDELLARRGVADLRGALFTTAELLHQAGSPAWEPIAATALVLPQVGLIGGPVDTRVDLPAPAVPPLTRRDATLLARAELRRLAVDKETSEPSAPAGPRPAPEQRVARFIDRRTHWEVAFSGRELHARPTKGMADIARLVAGPGQEIHCLDLMGAAVEEHEMGELVDPTARRAYEERIRELQADVESAEADNDLARADRAQAELDLLVDHLTASLGLGGRGRRVGGSAERARSAVTQRIRSTVRRLAVDHPELGRHLEASIVTGAYCSYRPEHPVDWVT